MQSPNLTAGTLQQIELADALVRRDLALVRLVTLLDPGNRLSTNGRAGAVSDRLRSFLDRAWPCIEAGDRQAHNPVESAMADLCRAGCPTSARRLFDLLAELRL